MNILKQIFQVWHQKPYSSRFTKEEAKAIADEHSLKAEVTKTMKNGCTPDEALLLWDIYPYGSRTSHSPNIYKSLIEENLNENPQETWVNIAVNSPDTCSEVLKTILEYENHFKYAAEEDDINRLRYHIEQQCSILDRTSKSDLVRLSQLLLKAQNDRSEKIILLNQMITDFGLDKSTINGILSNIDEELTRRMTFDMVLHTHPNSQIEDVIRDNDRFFYEKLEWLIHNETDILFEKLKWTVKDNIQSGQYNLSVKEEELKRKVYTENIDPEDFINKCVAARTEKDPVLTQEIEFILKNRFGLESMNAIRYLLNRCDDNTIRDFAYACLPPENLASKATVDIVVKRIGDIGKTRGNTGLFLIYTQKEDGEPKRLKFTHQASCIYYLMFLIDRCNSRHGTNRPSLRNNRVSFLNLYHKVYDIRQADLEDRFDKLLIRENKHGELRAGREKEIILDIKKHVRDAFEDYDESYYPYIMTAANHISISRERIHFVDEASDLLKLFFS